MNFTIQGGYAFGQSHDILQPQVGVITRAGQLTGAWQFTFADESGPSGTVHLDASTLFRMTAQGKTLSGLMRFHMHEINGDTPGSGWLFLTYEGTSLEFEGSKATFVVEGQFVGGTGRFNRATGSLRATSVNGFDTGSGTLVLGDNS